jgi:uncharacterized protein YjbI with pentapeptide repeats
MGKFGTGSLCGRALHNAPRGVDIQAVCLMHSHDLKKQNGQLSSDFWHTFESILTAAGQGEARFDRFVFPKLDLHGRSFYAEMYFTDAIFTQGADFFATAFTQYANFSGTIFSQEASFSGAIFMQAADFFEATFTQNVDFSQATFMQEVGFRSAIFTQNAEFTGASFMQNVDFGSATFLQNAGFRGAEFRKIVDWRRVHFLEGAELRHSTFGQMSEREPSAIFSLASFSKPEKVIFEHVDLSRALFHNCDVSEVGFTSSVDWGKRESAVG